MFLLFSSLFEDRELPPFWYNDDCLLIHALGEFVILACFGSNSLRLDELTSSYKSLSSLYWSSLSCSLLVS